MSRLQRFHTRRYRFRGWWKRAGWLMLAAALLLAWSALGDRIGPPAPVSEVNLAFRLCSERGSGACVIDGDTVAIGRRRVRLTGYDAPEMDGECEAERLKAREARKALLNWLARGRFEWTGGAEPPYDRYGRELREARRGDELLAHHMIAAGLAEGSGWAAQGVDWCL